jgi:hypothetical protein
MSANLSRTNYMPTQSSWSSGIGDFDSTSPIQTGNKAMAGSTLVLMLN